MTRFLARTLFVLFLWLLVPTAGFASGTIVTVVFNQGMRTSYGLNADIQLLIDPERRVSIEEITGFSDDRFYPPGQVEIPRAPFVAWSRIRLDNQGTEAIQAYFQVSSMADSVTVYSVRNGQVADQRKAGRSMRPTEKSLKSWRNYLPVTLAAGGATTYYFRTCFSNPVKHKDLASLALYPAETLIDKRINTYAWQWFYAGIMMIFCLVSLFLAATFGERVFVYYGLLVFIFAAYYLKMNDIADDLFMYRIRSEYFSIGQAIVSCYLLFAFLFCNSYLKVSRRMPHYYRVYLVDTIIVAVFAHLARLLTRDASWTLYAHNFLILVWLVMTLIPIVSLTIKRDPSARIALISASILLIGAIIGLLGQQRIIAYYHWMEYSAQVGTLVFSGILFYGLFDKINAMRQEKQRVEELDRLKSRFFTNISHEFRTPLTLIMGPIKEVMETSKAAEEKSLLQLAYRNAQRLLQLINQLLELSKLEAGKMELKLKKQNFAALLKGIVMSFESLAARKNIRLHFVSQKETLLLNVDKDKVEKIFYNLLSNAFKFSKEGGEVAVMVTDHKDQVEILVRDTGIGIPEARLSQIFDRFSQIRNAETKVQEGTGIGLALVKELIELHNGNILVASKPEKGSTFTVTLPKLQAPLEEKKPVEETPVAVPSTMSENEAISPLVVEENRLVVPPLEHITRLQSVLIVEDNEDVRAYIKQQLRNSFKILEAVDGEEGLEKARKHLPDLVISDVMMPKKNGYELCLQLKNDQRTSHIPVILLTAKAVDEEKIEGLETGADDYLVKPFDTKELEVRVRNLIRLRQTLRRRFSESALIETWEMGTNEIDQAFMEKVCATIEAELSNEQFSVEMLASAVGMSRVHLNRKLKALTDHSASKFILLFRLQQALVLLKEKAGNVTEIAFQTGFSSTSYFVKCFREQYGTTPGSLLEEQQ